MQELVYRQEKNHRPFLQVPTPVIMKCAQGGYVDLSNIPDNGSILASLDVDITALTNPTVKIDFTCLLYYRLVMLEELDLIFTLYRYSNRFGAECEMQELASWPYKILMDQNFPGAAGQNYVYTILEKNESFQISYCDQLTKGGQYRYIIKVDSTYVDITNASVQSGFISATAQSVYYD
jgi:hypothetical protein